MRSPRRVEPFRYCPDEFRLSDFRISKREVREEKKKKIFISLFLSLSRPHRPPFFLFLFLKVEPTYSLFFHFLIRFSSKTNHFIMVSISFIIIEYSLNIYIFRDFFYSSKTNHFIMVSISFIIIEYSLNICIFRDFF